MKKIIIVILAMISLIYVYSNSSKKEIIIPKEAIRFRVIANSNTVYDQNIKIRLKNVIQNNIFELTNDVKTIEEERKIIKENMQNIDSLVKKTLKDLKYDKDYTIKYGLNYFPKKEYKGITYKEGNYESLVITLGNGDGDNWWCVLFPPLCLVESDESNIKDGEYTFFIKELLEKYASNKYLTNN